MLDYIQKVINDHKYLLNMLELIYAFLVGITEYSSRQFQLVKHRDKILSFAAGVSITYLILELMPLFSEVAFKINKLLFLAVLLGFILHHSVEMTIYKHNRKHELVKKISLEENVFFYIYHFIVGVVLVAFLAGSVIQGTFFFISILAYTVVGNLPMRRQHKWWKSLFMASSTLTGTLFALIVTIPIWIQYSLIGFAIGVLLFAVTRHHIPFRQKGRIGFFLLGFYIYSILIVLSWYMV